MKTETYPHPIASRSPYLDGWDAGYEQALKDIEAWTPSSDRLDAVIADLRKRVAS